MKIERVLNYEPIFKANYAYLNLEKGIQTFELSNRPLPAKKDSNVEFSLKDVEYTIDNGILYIRGTRLEYYWWRQILEEVSVYGLREIYTIWNETRNQKLEEPLVTTDIVIKRWWRNNKKFKGIEHPYGQGPYWFKAKEEKPFEVAISDFILKEK